MDDKNFRLFGIDDVLDVTDSEESSSSSNPIFNSNEPYVLELHELAKDEPGTGSLPPLNVRKHKKKKKHLTPDIKRYPSDSSASVSETSSVGPSIDEAANEEYFDAHESYYTMPEYSVTPTMTGTSLMQTHSEDAPHPKAAQTTIAQRPQEAKREPTATDKPVTHSE